MKNKRGITLISLTITIIILIIIAGITINATIGDNGVLNRANKSRDRAEFSEKYEVTNNAIARAYTNSGTTMIDAAIISEYFNDYKVKFATDDSSEAVEINELATKILPIYVVFEDNTKIYINGNAEIDLNKSKTSTGQNAADVMK